jgi:LacI family transcriptional regulator
MRRRVTIQDIARHSNTSVTTVSLVLRDKPGIGDDTRQRVLDAARELGYRRRTPAADQQAVRSVAMILRARTSSARAEIPGVNPFYGDVISGIERAARRVRINLIYGTIAVDRANVPYELPDHLLRQPLDGILLIGSFSTETVDAIAGDRSAPTVRVDAPALPSAYDAVVSDNVGGAAAATRHLIELGHRHIALVAPEASSDPNFAQRREGYLAALDAAGIAPVFIPIPRSGLAAIAGSTAAALAGQPDVTAILGANDAAAIEALRGAQQAGRRVPEDLSVIGFDDIALASEIRPALTTMAVDRVTMGRQAVRLLEDRIEHPGACRLMTVLQPTLTRRDSTGPAPAGARAPATATA